MKGEANCTHKLIYSALVIPYVYSYKLPIYLQRFQKHHDSVQSVDFFLSQFSVELLAFVPQLAKLLKHSTLRV